MFPALLALALGDAALQQLFARKELLLKDIDEKERNRNRQSDNQVVPERHELACFEEIDELFQQYFRDDVADRLDDLAEDRDEGNDKKMGQDKNLRPPVLADARPVPESKDREEGEAYP